MANIDARDPLRLLAAKFSLHLVDSWEVPPVADELLTNGIYSSALAELATQRKPSWSDVVPLLENAMAELQMPFPSKAEAAWMLARHCILRIAHEAGSPFETLSLLQKVSSAAWDVLPDKAYVGENLDLKGLIGIYWSYTEPTENYYEPEKRYIHNESERCAILDRLAREESHLWLARHTSSP
ncbi:MAG TPA: hypothetical protein VHM90_17700 [Phycisphaerae bacterium]|nr:hypothetical protein [Phycisphaerae bacterium]